MPKPKGVVTGCKSSKKLDTKRRLNEGFDPNDPLRMFLWGPETKLLLTFEEESELILKIQVNINTDPTIFLVHYSFTSSNTLFYMDMCDRIYLN